MAKTQAQKIAEMLTSSFKPGKKVAGKIVNLLLTMHDTSAILTYHNIPGTKTLVLSNMNQGIGYVNFSNPTEKLVEVEGQGKIPTMSSTIFKINQHNPTKNYRFDRKDAGIDALFVDKKYRTTYSGIGTFLLSTAIHLLEKQNNKNIPTNVQAVIVNPNAVGFYKKHGLNIVKHTGGTISKSGTYWTADYFSNQHKILDKAIRKK